MPLIDVADLTKTFRVAVRRSGRFGALRTLLSREYRDVRAVDHVSFAIEAGEMVGYLGPNGAGKSTTLKMLTGILAPTSGRMSIDGRDPQRQRIEHVRRIGVVFGQRTQLWWDLPVIESFELLRHIYRMPLERWKANVATFDDLLGLGAFLNTPVRQISLGQRMRAELAAALLHDPAILFLDEPTIGLDVVARERIRQFLERINRERGVTVILTTHDLNDIERLCQRVILIDHGRVIYDGALETLRERFGRWRILTVDLERDDTRDDNLEAPGADVIERNGTRFRLRFDRDATTAAALIAYLSSRYPIRDLTLEEPEIEGVIRRIYEAPEVAQSYDRSGRLS